LSLANTIYADGLIEQCKNGERLAFKKVYENYKAAMYNTCYRMVNNATEAEDLCITAFADAFKNIAQFNYESTFGAWLKRITINKCINFLERNKHFYTELTQRHDVEENTEQFTEEEVNWQVQQIKNAAQQLATGFRTVLSLYLFEGYDHDEIADILKISPSTVRTQYKRAKEKLVMQIKNNSIYER
jgi:RNA polymerase sigma factor (sigma-70 family)